MGKSDTAAMVCRKCKKQGSDIDAKDMEAMDDHPQCVDVRAFLYTAPVDL
jgi:hypothetical protein